MKYGFIGFGNLAQAIYRGLKNEKGLEFACFDKLNKKDSEIMFLNSLEELVNFSDVLFLCVKPQNSEEVLVELKNLNLNKKVIVSPVAGKGVNFLESYLGKDVSIIRIMPNLAVSFKKSVTAYCFNSKQNELFLKIKIDLQKLGKVIELPEKHFDLFTAIFGSGPAFILEFLKVFKEKMVEFGISEEESSDLLVGLMSGTIAYFDENRNKKSISELINTVASKGGTTEAGLNYFRNNNLDREVGKVLEAARERSKELSA